MDKLSKSNLIEIVKKIKEADFDTEEDLDNALYLFLDNVPDPEASRLIYNIKPSLSPEEIVDKALAYKPIIFGPPPSEHK
jgi:hypothetical protein